jgi:transcriptional regulator with XRE-family HTH domain
MSADLILWMLCMKFPERLVTLRKQKGFTQQALADAIGLNVSQLKRYEGGTSQPTLEVLRKLSIALGVSADALIFEENERGPDDELRLQFEAISRFDPEERKVVKTLLDSLILKHEARRWSTS